MRLRHRLVGALGAILIVLVLAAPVAADTTGGGNGTTGGCVPRRWMYGQRGWHGHVLADRARRLQGQGERRRGLLRRAHVHGSTRAPGTSSRVMTPSDAPGDSGNVTRQQAHLGRCCVDRHRVDDARLRSASTIAPRATEARSRSPRPGPGSGRPSSRAARSTPVTSSASRSTGSNRRRATPRSTAHSSASFAQISVGTSSFRFRCR